MQRCWAASDMYSDFTHFLMGRELKSNLDCIYITPDCGCVARDGCGHQVHSIVTGVYRLLQGDDDNRLVTICSSSKRFVTSSCILPTIPSQAMTYSWTMTRIPLLSSRGLGLNKSCFTSTSL